MNSCKLLKPILGSLYCSLVMIVLSMIAIEMSNLNSAEMSENDGLENQNLIYDNEKYILCDFLYYRNREIYFKIFAILFHHNCWSIESKILSYFGYHNINILNPTNKAPPHSLSGCNVVNR